MKICNSLAELEKELNNRIADAMTDEVAETLKETLHTHIETDVYGTYEPKYYARRYENGGLADDENIVAEYDYLTNELIVVDIATGNPLFAPTDNSIAEIIETGVGYNYKFPFYEVARPFIQNTINELQTDKWHVKALEVGLNRRGVETE